MSLRRDNYQGDIDEDTPYLRWRSRSHEGSLVQRAKMNQRAGDRKFPVRRNLGEEDVSGNEVRGENEELGRRMLKRILEMDIGDSILASELDERFEEKEKT